jgi:alanine dehydrogenase
MSEIAGRAAVLHASLLLGKGKGKLVGGAAGVLPARSLVIGLGVAGTVAARGLAGLDSDVTGVDIDLERLRQVAQDGTVDSTLGSETAAIGEAVVESDIVIGAALVPGARAPIVITSEHVKAMKPGSVIVDLAIDQGGCVAGVHPTSHSDPTFLADDVIHYCVTNVPGQFPRTASRALSAAVSPKLGLLLRDRSHVGLRGALNTANGKIVHPIVAAALGGESPADWDR